MNIGSWGAILLPTSARGQHNDTMTPPMLGALMQLLAVVNTLLLLLLCWWSQYDAPVVNHAPLRLEQGLHPLPPNAIQSLIVGLGEATDKAERAASAASTSAAISSATTRSAATGNSHTPRLTHPVCPPCLTRHSAQVSPAGACRTHPFCPPRVTRHSTHASPDGILST